MTDQSLKQTVLDELAWEPSVSEAHIGVTARGGLVTLTGHVGSYAEKCAAEHAAGRVSGVKAIVEEHHGKINIESEVNKGTKFKVFLPFIIKE